MGARTRVRVCTRNQNPREKESSCSFQGGREMTSCHLMAQALAHGKGWHIVHVPCESKVQTPDSHKVWPLFVCKSSLFLWRSRVNLKWTSLSSLRLPWWGSGNVFFRNLTAANWQTLRTAFTEISMHIKNLGWIKLTKGLVLYIYGLDWMVQC